MAATGVADKTEAAEPKRCCALYAVARGVFIAFFVTIFMAGAGLCVAGWLIDPSPPRGSRSYRAQADVENLKNAVNLFRMELSRWPESLQELVRPPVTDSGLREEPYLEELPPDPWGSAYTYTVEDGQAVITSGGRDGRLGTHDDITNIEMEEFAAGG